MTQSCDRIRQTGRLDDAISDTVSTKEYIQYLMNQADPAAVRQMWQWSYKKGFDDDSLSVNCVNYFFRMQLFEAALEGWNRHFEGRQGYDRTSSVVFNGGFENELTGSELDWHFDGFNGVQVARDASAVHDGRFSLRIDFTGCENPDFHHVRQMVFVTPGHYHLEAFLRSADIMSDQGVRVSIRAANTAKVLAETEALTGTNDWRKLETDIHVPPGMTMAQVELSRHRSIRIDNQLTGTAWIDSVKLVRSN